MKRIIGAFILAVMIVSLLAGCGLNVPPPSIKDGRFNVSVTYEVDGVPTTVTGVFVCEYDGVWTSLDGHSYRCWEDHFEGEINSDVIEVLETENGEKVVFSFLIYAEYFMGEPGYEDYNPMLIPSIVYYNEDGDELTDSCDEDRLLEEYGVRLICIEYDDPIVNTFGYFK